MDRVLLDHLSVIEDGRGAHRAAYPLAELLLLSMRACWPDRPELVALDGKTLRRSHDRSVDEPAPHLVSAFATIGGLVLGQEAVADKSNQLSAIPVLLERLALDGGLNGAIVSIDAVA